MRNETDKETACHNVTYHWGSKFDVGIGRGGRGRIESAQGHISHVTAAGHIIINRRIRAKHRRRR
jgi:hypothetical protein